MGVLYRELSALYGALSRGEASPLPRLPLQYADYAVWQREWLTGEVLDSQLRYWKQQLEGAPEVLELPTNRPRPPVMSQRGDSVRFQLPVELSQQLRELSRAEGVTLFMTLLAAFQTLLYRYTGQEDLVVGSPIANRNRAETEGLIGFFANTLVLRTKVGRRPTRRLCSSGARGGAGGICPPGGAVREAGGGARGRSARSSTRPIFQAVFALQNAPPRRGSCGWAGWSWRRLAGGGGVGQVRPAPHHRGGGRRACARHPRLRPRPVRRLARWRRLTGRTSASSWTAAVAGPDAPVSRAPADARRRSASRVLRSGGTARRCATTRRSGCVARAVRRAGGPHARRAWRSSSADTSAHLRASFERAGPIGWRSHLTRARGGAGGTRRRACAVERSPELVVGLLGGAQGGRGVRPARPGRTRRSGWAT